MCAHRHRHVCVCLPLCVCVSECVCLQVLASLAQTPKSSWCLSAPVTWFSSLGSGRTWPSSEDGVFLSFLAPVGSHSEALPLRGLCAHMYAEPRYLCACMCR